MLNCKGHDQNKDPFFSGQSDWAVWERNVAYGAKSRRRPRHLLSQRQRLEHRPLQRDVRQCCRAISRSTPTRPRPATAAGIAFDDPRCDAYAGEGEGGQGASDYFLVEGNYFHHGSANGPNFTSVRRSVVRNNIFGPQARHNVSFWQETDNPKLGSSDNKILHNLFLTTGRHGVKFENNSTRNEFANNVILGVQVDGGGKVTANPTAPADGGRRYGR